MTTIGHLDGLTKVDANGKKSKYDVELRNKFRAVTIYNSVRTDKKTEQRLIDAAVKIILKERKQEKELKTLLRMLIMTLKLMMPSHLLLMMSGLDVLQVVVN